jgi:hypothetical protein
MDMRGGGDLLVMGDGKQGVHPAIPTSQHLKLMTRPDLFL